ncbi:MAG: 16S rRNA (guanine(966)-N(2))-methyltransferase RsmD [Alphaproteobacteria bacterium]|nr:16S rRNA (guanine(966)-N(2))-methyltransferase RsmD [Alphaproteobacteria bacterium]
MRIVGGAFGGRRLEAPSGRDIRPTSDKVRGSIFNALAARAAIDGAVVLDGFCGSGALGLEALSRGAARCVFIDSSRRSLDLAKRNAESLGVLDRCSFVLGDCAKPGVLTGLEGAFDLALFDPPYGKGLANAVLNVLPEAGILLPQAVIVVEEDKIFEPDLRGSFSVQNRKTYGDTQVLFLDYAA